MIIVFFGMIVFSANVGSWVESSPDRLRTLQTTIAVNRGSVVAASVAWLLMLSQEDLLGPADDAASSAAAFFRLPKSDGVKAGLFAAAVALGIVERLSASGNMISMERDWVVAVAAPPGSPYDLTHLNAVMRRIDLVCKLLSPIALSAFVSTVGSARAGVLFVGLGSLASLPVELLSAWRAWRSSEPLQRPKLPPRPPPTTALPGISSENDDAVGAAATHTTAATIKLRMPRWIRSASAYLGQFRAYLSTPVWIPSVALAMLRYNMLTWRATFITYLINVGYSLNAITLARAAGSLFEITSTVLAPVGIRYFGRALHHHDDVTGGRAGEDEAAVAFLDQGDEAKDADGPVLIGLQRTGLWGFTLQVLNLVRCRPLSPSLRENQWQLHTHPAVLTRADARRVLALDHLG